MCGVAAIFAYHDAAPEVDRRELDRTLESMVRRGPDGEGVWHEPSGRFSAGHRRLALLDPSLDGAQPMVGARSGIVLAWNGEIYNHEELRRSLTQDGTVVHQRSDTAVLLAWLEAHGERGLPRLRGMFAIAWFDRRRRVLSLARDSYGIKPLYYADDGWSVRVASQVSALRAGGRVSSEVDPAARVGFLVTGSVPEPLTSLRDVRAVPAGTVVRVGSLGAESPVYFQRAGAVIREATSSAVHMDPERAQSAVRSAVGISASADAQVGVFLSDGVDSSLVLRHATSSGYNLPSLTIRFEDAVDGVSCASAAEKSARACGSEHHTHVVSRTQVESELATILRRMDQPSIDGINVWFASRAAKQAGWTAALSGIGGDELLGGYPSFRDVPKWSRIAKLPGSVPGLGRGLRMAATRLLTGMIPPKSAGMIEYARSFAGAWLLRRGLFMPWELPGLIGEEATREGLTRFAPLQHIGQELMPMPESDYGRVAVLESCLYLRNQLLRDADWASMAHSVEVRVPFTDCHLAREALPWMGRDGRDKARLHATAPVPEAAAPQPKVKSGFHVPLDHWLDTMPGLDSWRRVPALRTAKVRPSRRWAYVVADAKGLL